MEHHEIKEDLGRWQRIAWVAGAIGAAGTAAGYVLAPGDFFPSYLMAFFYWFCLAGGSLGLLLIHHLVAGHWGFVIQRPLEAAARTIPCCSAWTSCTRAGSIPRARPPTSSTPRPPT
jgi:hypothetical protein